MFKIIIAIIYTVAVFVSGIGACVWVSRHEDEIEDDRLYDFHDFSESEISQLGKLIEDVDEALQVEIQNRTAADAKETLARIKAVNEIWHALKKNSPLDARKER